MPPTVCLPRLAIEMSAPSVHRAFRVCNYDLAATLSSGQAFRWREENGVWIGVIDKYWVQLRQNDRVICAETAQPITDWHWLTEYLQLGVNLETVIASFPDDAPMRAAITAWNGLRLLRQDPWECLASFILSATKQIVQIQQIIEILCQRYGEPIKVPKGQLPAFAFPKAARLARATETGLRACKMGFRAPHLIAAARAVTDGKLDLEALRKLPREMASEELMKLPGVGPKIANCVLLFAYGFQDAFPVDVWIAKALRQLYFPRQRPSLEQLRQFAANHFGPHAGYAQQYLFHFMRMKNAGLLKKSNAPKDTKDGQEN